MRDRGPALRIDLNADVGELPGAAGTSTDAAILRVVTSASIACGAHAGDAETMRRTCAAAVACGVAIGAHIGYRDRDGFGRRPIDVTPEHLGDETAAQLAALAEAAHAEGTTVRFVKPHGALYHRLSADGAAAAAVARACLTCTSVTAVLCPPRAALLAAASGLGLDGVAEGFADRGYASPDTLLARDREGAVLPADRAAAQACAIVIDHVVPIAIGVPAPIAVRSICVHGDAPGAAATAAAVATALRGRGVELHAFA